ncbi:phage portal protein family protein [Pseudotenacibaculum haliotis]|uniref:DUF935 family protein n=1 Tax=Pseudotenacibaculum haliotis TaxID=1862138 RepID=A0ABW5LPI2_9FLAO
MGLKDSIIYKYFEKQFLSNADQMTINIEAASRKQGSSLTDQMTMTATTLQKQTLKEWKAAILLATDPEDPNRLNLKELYQSLKLDNHLMATIGNRIDAVRGSAFKLVDKSGKENPEMTDILKKLWFIEEEGFIHIALMSKYTGTKVIELFDLKENGHLKQVTEVDMAHVIPQKGMIVKEVGDAKGWNYKEGAFKDYYLQVGKDNMLGLFAMLAPIVLAKKLGIGSWLDYIEKYGIPPIFVFTDRFDKKRMTELYNSMLNFKSNHFVIAQGNEKIEHGTNANAGNSAVFKDLTKLANDEISKRINGATGSTDEKAHVGAANVHENILNTKIKLDKFFIEILVNEELIPRLVKLSPVYSGLDNYKFEWDDAETLTLQELIDAVVSFSSFYEIDVEYLSEKTGIPITGLKSMMPQTNNPEPQKKKSSLNLGPSAERFDQLYPQSILELDIQAIDLSKYTKLVGTIAKGLHDGTFKPESLSEDLINQIYSDIVAGARDGWGNGFTKFGKDPKKDRTVLAMQKNIFRFSGAKTYAQLLEFNDLQFHHGNQRSFKDFKEQVQKANKRYNENYLQAEHQTARQSGNQARNWQSYEKDKDLFPNLEYRTAGDERVREDHSVFDGIVKPVDDPFWDSFYPPNGWRCRCYVVQTTNSPTSKPTPKNQIKPEFKINVGKTGSVYSEKHPFFVISRAAPKKVQSAFELSKLHAPYTKIYTGNGGADVKISPFADPKDLPGNFAAAKKLSDSGISVKIRPHIIEKGYKNPEFEIDKKLADRKTQKGKNISSNLRSAKSQGVKVIVFDIHQDYPFSVNRFKSQLKGLLKHYKKDTFDTVILISGKAVERIKISDLLK